MPLDFSSESHSIEVPTQFQTGFSDVGGAATGVNVNVAGKIGKKATVTPVVNLSDYGAIASAFDYGQAALDMGRDTFDTAAHFAGRAGEQVGDIASQSLANSRDALRDSLDFGDSTIQRFADFGDNALHSYGSFASDIFSEALGAQRDVTEANLTGLQSLAMQTSASSDDRVQKVALYALAALAAVMVLPRIFGKSA